MSPDRLAKNRRVTPRYTHLFATISEDDGGFTVQVKLHTNGKSSKAAWGQEIADSFETASSLIEALAHDFSIAQTCIKIEIRMSRMTEGTRH
jgi:hypothetical protein